MKSLLVYALASLVFSSNARAVADLTPAEPCIRADTVTATTKRGIPYTDASLTVNFGSKVTWAYDYTSTPGALSSNFEFVPMLHDSDPNTLATWMTDAQNAINNGATHLLGFNEPDQIDQSNISPSVAAILWQEYMQPFAGQAMLCSPAISQAAGGTTWMDQFLAACGGCTIDCLAFHADSETSAEELEEYAVSIGQRYNKPLWLTEFFASGSSDQQESFLQQVLPFLDNMPQMERYAYFMAGDDILVDDNGNLTPMGEIYNSG